MSEYLGTATKLPLAYKIIQTKNINSTSYMNSADKRIAEELKKGIS